MDECKHCGRDARNNPARDPRYWGTLCDECEREIDRKEMIAKGFESAGFTPRLLRLLRTLTPTPGQREVESWEPRDGGALIVQGQIGSGKTVAVAFLVHRLVGEGHNACIGNLVRVFRALREGYGQGAVTTAETDGPAMLERLRETRIAVFDDLCAERPTEWARELLYDTVNFRYEHDLPIVITTNVCTAELSERVGERVVSRLIEMARLGRVVKLDGGDRRLG